MIDYLAVFAGVEDPARPWTWRELEVEIRDGLYRSLEAEQAAAATVRQPCEAARILALGQEAFGDLRGLLAGLPNELLDSEPMAGEWPLRKTLEHLLMVEVSFRVNTRYALSRSGTDPVRAPLELRPREGDADASGGFEEILVRFAMEREATDTEFEGVEGERMLRPTFWSGAEVDVRFRLNRFGGHLAEHTIQCEKTLAWLGRPPGEARLITRKISALRGLHERYCDPAVLDELDRVNRERARSFGRAAG